MNKKIFGLAALALVILIAPVYADASTNVTLLYGYNGTQWVPLKTLPDGTLDTTLNLSESIGLNPKVNNTYDLGAATLLWANLYARSIRSGGFLSIIGDANVTGTFYASGIIANLENSTGLTNVSLLYGVNQSNPEQQIPATVAANGALRMSVEQANINTANGLAAGATGADLTLSGNLIAANINVTGTTANSTFSGDVRIFGTLYGGSPLKVAGGLNVSGGIIYNTIVNNVDNVSLNINNTLYVNGSNVGIGTTSPVSKLQVNGNVNVSGSGGTLSLGNNDNSGAFIRFNGANANNFPNWQIDQISTGNGLGFTPSTTNGGGTFSTPTLYLLGGSVGIGTTSPIAKLEITPLSGQTNIRIGGDSDVAYNKPGGFYFSNADGTYANALNLFEMVPSTTNRNNVLLQLHSKETGTTSKILRVTYGNNASSPTSEAMTILSTGNVGIGTTSPIDKLEVQTTGEGRLAITTSAADSNRNHGFRTNYVEGGDFGIVKSTAALGNPFTAGTTLLYLRENGNVGIGTTAPAANIDVTIPYAKTDTTARNFAYLGKSNDATTYSALQMYVVGGATAANRYWVMQTIEQTQANAGSLVFQPSGGKVGIGTTTPGSLLTVGSSASSSDTYNMHVAGGNTYSLVVRQSTTGTYSEGSNWDFYAGGSGSNYGPFTGAHDVRLPSGFSAEPGMIVSSVGDTINRNNTLSTTLIKVKLSDTENDNAVLGVFVTEESWDDTRLGWYKKNNSDGERFGIVNALGEGRVLVTNINGEIKNGDYITTSSITGYGQKQNDDLLHSYTLGKSTENVDWNKVNRTVTWNGKIYKVYLIGVVYTSG